MLMQDRSAAASAARAGLSVLSLPYALGQRLHALPFDLKLRTPAKLPRPVVSVGNLTTGGTGKTPAVAMIVRMLQELGERPAVLLRGYKAVDNQSDEAAVLMQELGAGVPVQANPNRVAGAQAALQANPQVSVLVLDDGFQHRRVARELDLVLLDATVPAGAMRLLPRGFMREPWSALKRATGVILTRADQASPRRIAELEQQVLQVTGRKVLAHASHVWVSLVDEIEQPQPVDAITGKQVTAICGIGNPDAFKLSVQAHAQREPKLIALPDHHAYEAAELSGLLSRAKQQGSQCVVTTEKDWVKWRRLGVAWPLPVCRPKLEMRLLTGEAEVRELLRAAIGA